MLESTLNGAIKVLTDLLAIADPEAFGHAQRLREEVRTVAEWFGVGQPWDFEIAAMLSQIGTVASRAVSFTESRDGELLLVGYDTGVIYRIDLSKVDPSPIETDVLAETSEQSGVVWRMTLTSPESDWFSPSFDDHSWTNALGGFGTVGTPGAVIGTEWRTDSIWLRREFSLPESFSGSEARRLVLRLHHDEDVEVYLNGIEVLRRPRWTTGYIDIPLNREATAALRPGRNVLSIHCRQNRGGQYIDAGLLEYIPSDPKKTAQRKPYGRGG